MKADALPAETAAERASPMMAQYIEIKAANPDSLLFYRMGDFFELFFEDAELASRALGIALTKRGKHQGADIPMCGVPVDRADDYLQRLIAAGFRVAVCEQLEDPAEARKRGSKSVVRRDVVRLVTPGTLTEDSLLDARRGNLLVALVRLRASDAGWSFGLAWVDLSTGAFGVAETDRTRLLGELARLEPAEIVLADTLREDPDLRAPLAELRIPLAGLSRDAVDPATAEARLCRYFEVATSAGFGQLSRPELTAAAAVLTYVERTQLGTRARLSRPIRTAKGTVLEIDAATRANLELTRTFSGDRAGSLLGAVDRTVTAAGARLLAERLAGPLTNVAAIEARLDAVAALAGADLLRGRMRKGLAGAPDLARASQRLVLGRGGPRDLSAVGRALAAAAELAEALAGMDELPAELSAIAEALGSAGPDLAGAIEGALADELPLLKRDGNFVRPGYNAELDETRDLRDESRRVIAALQARYAEATDTRTLRIKYNNFLGYFVEVPQAAGERFRMAPHAETFVHRQTMAGAMRFTTAELGDLEQRIEAAGSRAQEIENAIFDRLAASVTAAAEALQRIADALAALDVAAGLAEIACDERWVRPRVDETCAFAIDSGRHPVVEQALRASGKPFVANSAELSPAPPEKSGLIWLVTGPNMAGKSTFLRQNAILAVLAQAGSFVPAKAAHIGIVDRLFSRVGAADDLARGRSTFMVEMVETAAILNQATPRSLVILDEIGRGTATFDGLSIAWATIEHLHETNRSRALFATHFHELTALAKRLPRLRNTTVRVADHAGDVIFLHEIVPGTADRSYGIQVARLAGLPQKVVERAKHILAELEAADRASPVERLVDDLPLFAAARRPEPAAPADPVAEALEAIDPDALSPREALEALYRLKGLRKG